MNDVIRSRYERMYALKQELDFDQIFNGTHSLCVLFLGFEDGVQEVGRQRGEGAPLLVAANGGKVVEGLLPVVSGTPCRHRHHYFTSREFELHS
jgi:hypothetical protein